MYFSRFGKIQYGFDKDNFKIVTDVMKRVKVKDKVLNEFSLYDKYDVQSGDTPESIAFKHFGNAEGMDRWGSTICIALNPSQSIHHNLSPQAIIGSV